MMDCKRTYRIPGGKACLYACDTAYILAETGITARVRKQDNGVYALMMKSSQTNDEPLVKAQELALAITHINKVKPRPPGLPSGSVADVITH